MENKKEKKNTHEVHFDYKNVNLLLDYTNPHGRVLSRKRTELPARKQRELARAIKRAREMALIPYIVA